MKDKLSAFNYFGGKNHRRLQDFIISKISNLDIYHYAEPFGGSFAVGLNVRNCKLKTFNDLNSDIYNFFYCLRNDPDKLISLIELTPYSRQEYNSIFPNENIQCSYERARVFFIRTVQSFGNSGALQKYNSWSYTIRDSRYNVSQSVARFLSKVEGLTKVVNELRKVQLECIDFEKFITKYDSTQTFFYIDPPYLPETRSYHIKYKYELSFDDHIKLIEILKGIKGRFLLSGYKSELYDSLLKDFHSESLSNVMTNGKKKLTETLWSNYSLTKQNLFTK